MTTKRDGGRGKPGTFNNGVWPAAVVYLRAAGIDVVNAQQLRNWCAANKEIKGWFDEIRIRKRNAAEAEEREVSFSFLFILFYFLKNKES